MSDAIAALRAEVMAQPMGDRLDYALELLEWYLDPLPAWWQGVSGLGLDVTRADLRVLHALDRRRGLYVSHDALLTARSLGDDPEELPSLHTLSRAIGNLRRALTAKNQPVTITAWAGMGYRLDAPVDWRIDQGGR